ncbi:thioredoxin-like protein [Desarmillaria tabescens]|uniref:Thioredoxin-like protein n=1 Tax=Armillaria tabescens TaxID=1929756 RepID=A0AA39NMJ2_ARMTA|nr:thioredoxin-like protein [Desarmillaria tabescens]KAK0468158.1 thioredoxin-like protein [Desarmillaria tabescens]
MSSNKRIETLAARLVEPNDPRDRAQDSDDDETLFAELEAEIENDENYAMREQGLEVLKREMDKMQAMKQNQHGSYTEIFDEKEVIRVTAQEPKSVVHFYHSNFKRCEIMDKHLAALAPKYFNTRFIRVFVENVPWLVEKLAIKVLPCVICFVNGTTKDRIIGFEELGNNDAFTTAMLELRLSVSGRSLYKILGNPPGVLQKQQPPGVNDIYNVSSSSAIRTKRKEQEDDRDIFDLDD